MRGQNELRDGDRRNVTVLFADMKDFTSISERMDPEEMDALMTRVFASFESIVRRYGGTVEKYIGDALVAVFGVPSIHEDDPVRAVNCALDVLDEVKRVNRTVSDSRGSIEFRIGVHTGLITTGKRGEHDVVTGHAMSITSRLESEAPANSILVSGPTHDLTEAEFEFSGPREIRVKGVTGAIVAYEIAGRKDRPVEDEVFIGRREILDGVFRRFLRHEPDNTDGIILVGDAGMGKSRLAAEVINRCRQLPDFGSPILYARAARYRTIPFAVVVDLLSGHFGLEDVETRAEAEAVIARQSTVESRTAAGFADLVAGNETGQDNEAFVVLYLMLKDVLKKFADEPYPPLLVVENLHFMDRQSRDFFRFYLKNADIKPFLLLTDRHPDPGVREVFSALDTIELSPLTRTEASELIDRLAGTSLTEETRASILDNSQGNPLFVREYVRFAADNRTNTLPTTIQNIFLTSVDPFDPPMRDLLKKLSVFAHSFEEADAVRVHEQTDGEAMLVPAALSFFVRESILLREGELFMFRHDMFKKALYDSLLNYNKKILHGVIATMMVEKGDPHPLRLLLHLIRAEQYDRAIDSMWNVTGLTGNLEYLPYIDTLLSNVEEADVDRYLGLLFVKSAILFNNGMSDEADGLLKDIISVSIREHSHTFAGSAYHLLTAYNMKSYAFGKARYCGRNALFYYRSALSPPHRVQNLLEIMASSEMLQNQTDEVGRIVAEIEKESGYGQSEETSVHLAVFRAEGLLLSGRYQDARRELKPRMNDLHEQNERWLRAHLILGIASFNLCDWRELMRVDLAVLEGPSRHYSNISQINAQIAVAHHFLGDAKSAVQRFQQAEFTSSQVKNDFDRLDAFRTLAASSLIMGDTQKAAEYAHAGCELGIRHSATYPVMTVLMVLAEIAAITDRADEVRFYLTEARLLMGRNVLLPNRDVALFHYFAARFADDPQIAEDSGREAKDALLSEIERFEDEDLVSSFLKVRSFGKIYSELLGDPDLSSA